MRTSPIRLALALAALLALTRFNLLAAAEPEPAKAAPASAAPVPAAPAVVAPAPAVTPPPVVADQDTAEAKLAVVLRSYTLLQDENEQLKAVQDKNSMEKSSLEAQLAVTKGAVPQAAQAAALREQLRQTQDQLAALSLENNQLKTRLALAAPAPGTLMPATVGATVTSPPAGVVAAPAVRYHVVAAHESLGKIALMYYGNANRWPEILAANRDILHSEKSLVVGSKLRIP